MSNLKSWNVPGNSFCMSPNPEIGTNRKSPKYCFGATKLIAIRRPGFMITRRHCTPQPQGVVAKGPSVIPPDQVKGLIFVSVFETLGPV